ncbi:hypothetical protein GCM10009827_084170 [Dactylosporangium maewongense]|uniref:Helix-turn-helix domain-containing protein n=1 Tax=Dactylosporangium maewongense TaxID=634393 RepID=A0ABP4MUS9_9ACTN
MAAEILYTVSELAALWRCSKNFIYDEISRGRLQSVNLGAGRAKTRIPESIADEYWKKQLAAEPAKLRMVG